MYYYDLIKVLYFFNFVLTSVSFCADTLPKSVKLVTYSLIYPSITLFEHYRVFHPLEFVERFCTISEGNVKYNICK